MGVHTLAFHLRGSLTLTFTHYSEILPLTLAITLTLILTLTHYSEILILTLTLIRAQPRMDSPTKPFPTLTLTRIAGGEEELESR